MDINPIDKKNEICKLLDDLEAEYEIHTFGEMGEEYDYLEEGNICITVLNPTCQYKLYIDLEYYGEFTLSYYRWHAHYFPDEMDYEVLCNDLAAILNNTKCTENVSSKKRWIYNTLKEIKDIESYNFKVAESLPDEFIKELKKVGGSVELFFWDCNKNIRIDISI